MSRRTTLAIVLGAIAVGGAGAALGFATGPEYVGGIEQTAAAAIRDAGGAGVTAQFDLGAGPTRHPVLRGGNDLSDETRMKVARAVASVPGIGGVRWEGVDRVSADRSARYEPLHCQKDVEGLLKTRSVRFQEGSAALADGSGQLLDEVAKALRPCQGAIIAIDGHTDRTGSEGDNLALSMSRARSVREALVARGIPRDALRARGHGSAEPVDGLAPNDPANRRIEFAVIRKEPLHPTPVDTPQAY